MRIESFELLDSKYKTRLSDETAEIESMISFNNVNVTFEVDSELSEYKAHYTVVLWSRAIDFSIKVVQQHETKAVEAFVKFDNFFGTLSDRHVYNFPSNPYTQIIGKEVSESFQVPLCFSG